MRLARYRWTCHENTSDRVPDHAFHVFRGRSYMLQQRPWKLQFLAALGRFHSWFQRSTHFREHHLGPGISQSQLFFLLFLCYKGRGFYSQYIELSRKLLFFGIVMALEGETGLALEDTFPLHRKFKILLDSCIVVQGNDLIRLFNIRMSGCIFILLIQCFIVTDCWVGGRLMKGVERNRPGCMQLGLQGS